MGGNHVFRRFRLVSALCSTSRSLVVLAICYLMFFYYHTISLLLRVSCRVCITFHIKNYAFFIVFSFFGLVYLSRGSLENNLSIFTR